MNIQFPFDWPDKSASKAIVVDATHADLIALEQPELKDKVAVRCGFCHGRIRFCENWQDPSESQYACYGLTSGSYLAYGDEHCYNKIRKWQLASFSAEEVQRRFYIQLDLPDKKIYRMCYEANGPTTSYHYVREVTQNEYREEAVKELEKIRQRAMGEESDK